MRFDEIVDSNHVVTQLLLTTTAKAYCESRNIWQFSRNKNIKFFFNSQTRSLVTEYLARV